MPCNDHSEGAIFHRASIFPLKDILTRQESGGNIHMYTMMATKGNRRILHNRSEWLFLRRMNAMLVLSRKPGEKINIGSGITITVVEVRGNKIRLGIDAPESVSIFRAELYDLLAKIGTDAGEPAEHELAQAF